jgi:multidrug efflux system membrane fusion protein
VRELRRIQGRTLQQGDAVARGTVLARLDPADYQEKVNQGKAQEAEAEASLIKARADAGRAEALYRCQALTRPDYDAAVANLAAAGARREAARAQLEAAVLTLRDATLVAPADGVILSRSVEVGALAGAGTVAFTLGDLGRVKAVFGVPDRLVERVTIGTPLRLTTDAFGAREFEGRISAVSPAADTQSRVFYVEVTMPNPDRILKAGMVASVEVPAGAVPDIPQGAPTVSVSAVVKSGSSGAYAVFVAEGADEETTVRSRDMELGPLAGNRVAALEGLRPGERVVVSGASLLADGDRVRIIPGRPGE